MANRACFDETVVGGSSSLDLARGAPTQLDQQSQSLRLLVEELRFKSSG